VSFVFGAAMNLWFWPYLAGAGTLADPSLSYIPGGPLGANLARFAVFSAVSSSATWDLVRAIATVFLIALLGRPILLLLRRATG
jgi:hypothetical protein